MTQQSQHSSRLARRERRIERRRTEILEAAARVFAERGYDATTTRDIAEAVDMGESTLYNYFQNKREVLLAIVNRKRLELDEFFAQIGPVVDRPGLVNLIDQMMVFWFSRANFTRTLIGEAWRNPEIMSVLQERLERLIILIQAYLENQVEAGHFRTIQTLLVARMILGMFFSLQLPVIFGSQPELDPQSRRHNAEVMADFLLNGIESSPESASR